jgi:CheY-like chemotaxis protein
MPARLPLIAVVDDEQSVRKAMERLIRTGGFEVALFSSGAEFLSSLQQRKPDCVVLDLHMPGIDGFEVMAALARAATGLPFIVMTADDSPQNRARALNHGARAYLPKPVDGAALLEALNAAVRH